MDDWGLDEDCYATPMDKSDPIEMCEEACPDAPLNPGDSGRHDIGIRNQINNNDDSMDFDLNNFFDEAETEKIPKPRNDNQKRPIISSSSSSSSTKTSTTTRIVNDSVIHDNNRNKENRDVCGDKAKGYKVTETNSEIISRISKRFDDTFEQGMTGAMMSGLKWPIAGTKEDWPVHDVYAINIPSKVMKNGANHIGDIDTATVAGKAHYALLRFMFKSMSYGADLTKSDMMKMLKNDSSEDGKGKRGNRGGGSGWRKKGRNGGRGGDRGSGMDDDDDDDDDELFGFLNDGNRISVSKKKSMESEVERMMQESSGGMFLFKDEDGMEHSLPWYTTLVENLVNNRNAVVGHRILFYIHYKKHNLAKNMLKMMQYNSDQLKIGKNKTAAAKRAKTNSVFFDFQKTNRAPDFEGMNPGIPIDFEDITDPSGLASLLRVYYYGGNAIRKADATKDHFLAISHQYSKVTDLTMTIENRSNPMHPSRVFSINNAIKYNTCKVCDEQVILDNYVNQCPGMPRALGRYVVPIPVLAYSPTDVTNTIKDAWRSISLLKMNLVKMDRCLMSSFIRLIHDDNGLLLDPTSEEYENACKAMNNATAKDQSRLLSPNKLNADPQDFDQGIDAEEGIQELLDVVRTSMSSMNIDDDDDDTMDDESSTSMPTSRKTIDSIEKKLRKKLDKMTNEGKELLKAEMGVDMGNQTASMSVKTIILARSRLLQLRSINNEKRKRIKERFPLENMKEYKEEMMTMKTYAVTEYWDEMLKVVDTPERDSPWSNTIRAMMAWYLRLTPKNKWSETDTQYPKLSQYANMRIQTDTRYRNAFRLKEGTPSRLLFKLTIARDNALTFDFGLHLNFLLDGEKESGKSHVLAALELMSVDGSIQRCSHMSKKAMTTNEDLFNDAVMLFHEAPIYMLGIDEAGRTIPGDEIVKDRMTSNYVTTYRYQVDPQTGDSRCVQYVCRCMGSTIMATNAPIPINESPITSRMVRDIVYRYESEFSTMELSLFNDDNSISNERYKEAVCEKEKLIHFFVMVIEKAIEAGAIEDVDMNVARMYVLRVVDILVKDYNIDKPSTRKIEQLIKLARGLTIRAVIHIVYFSEYGRVWRYDNDGNYKDFDPMSLLDVENRLVCTEEIIADAFSLMETNFIPIHIYNVLEICKELIRSQRNVTFRTITRSKGNGDVSVMVDKNYYQFPYENIDAFHIAIFKTMEHRNRYQLNTIRNIIDWLKDKSVTVSEQNDEPINEVNPFIPVSNTYGTKKPNPQPPSCNDSSSINNENYDDDNNDYDDDDDDDGIHDEEGQVQSLTTKKKISTNSNNRPKKECYLDAPIIRIEEPIGAQTAKWSRKSCKICILKEVIDKGSKTNIMLDALTRGLTHPLSRERDIMISLFHKGYQPVDKNNNPIPPDNLEEVVRNRLLMFNFNTRGMEEDYSPRDVIKENDSLLRETNGTYKRIDGYDYATDPPEDDTMMPIPTYKQLRIRTNPVVYPTLLDVIHIRPHGGATPLEIRNPMPETVISVIDGINVREDPTSSMIKNLSQKKYTPIEIFGGDFEVITFLNRCKKIGSYWDDSILPWVAHDICLEARKLLPHIYGHTSVVDDYIFTEKQEIINRRFAAENAKKWASDILSNSQKYMELSQEQKRELQRFVIKPKRTITSESISKSKRVFMERLANTLNIKQKSRMEKHNHHKDNNNNNNNNNNTLTKYHSSVGSKRFKRHRFDVPRMTNSRTYLTEEMDHQSLSREMDEEPLSCIGSDDTFFDDGSIHGTENDTASTNFEGWNDERENIFNDKGKQKVDSAMFASHAHGNNTSESLSYKNDTGSLHF